MVRQWSIVLDVGSNLDSRQARGGVLASYVLGDEHLLALDFGGRL
jgi:hypothetical protein